MAVKSIIDVDVNDEAFKNFQALYEKYQKALEKAPGTWAAATAEIQKQRKGFESIAAALLAQNEIARRGIGETERGGHAAERSAGLWRSMAQSTKSVAANVKEATTSLLKWSALTGLITGLVGAGGLYGIDRLALGVASTRKSALGLGLTFGEQKAFTTNFERLVADPAAFLHEAAAARFDITKRVGLVGAGLTPAEMAGDTAQVGTALLTHLKNIADNTDPRLFAQVIQARRLPTTPEELERLRETPRDEFVKLLQQMRDDQEKFGLPKDMQLRWQNFVTQMSRAGQGIENTFVKGLAPLAPGLTKLSESFEKVVRAFLGSPALERWIGDVDSALEKFAGYIGTEDFAKKVGDFVTGVGEMADAAGKAVAWFHGWFSGGNKDGTKPDPMSPVPYDPRVTSFRPSLGVLGGEQKSPEKIAAEKAEADAKERMTKAWQGIKDVSVGALDLAGKAADKAREVLYGKVPGSVGEGFGFERLPPSGRAPKFATGDVRGAAGLPESAGDVRAGLEKRGFTSDEAAATVGNLVAEFALRPGAVNKTSGAFGFEQLLGDRLRGYVKFAKATERNPSDKEAQLDWIKMERTGESVKWGGSDERKAYAQAFSAGDIEAKAAAFGRLVERPSAAELAGSLRRRESAAVAALTAKTTDKFALEKPRKEALAYTGEGKNGGQLSDRELLEKLAAMLSARERKTTGGDKYQDSKVVVDVRNNTGGNANISINALKN